MIASVSLGITLAGVPVFLLFKKKDVPLVSENV